jgi:hypothetical protein
MQYQNRQFYEYGKHTATNKFNEIESISLVIRDSFIYCSLQVLTEVYTYSGPLTL